MEFKGTGTRLLATAVDGLIVWGLMLLMGKLTGKTFSFTEGTTILGLAVPTWLIVTLVYFTIFEGIKGATAGKMIMGLKVVKEDGKKCDLFSAIVRNVIRPIDIVTFFIWATNKNQRLGDFIAKTYVVEEAR